MQEYLAGYRDAIEKVFELQKDKAGFPTLKQALLEEFFKKSANPIDIGSNWLKGTTVTYPALGHPPYCGSVSTSLSGSAALRNFALTGNDDSPMLESREL